MDLDNPSFITLHVIRKIDPAIFYWIFCCFRTFIFVLDYIFDTLFGYTITKGSRAARERSKEYEHSAQLCHIMGRGAYTIVQNQKLHNFCCRHIKYVHPRYILEHDNITLFGVTKTHAFFCVSDPNFNIYETKCAPFIFIIHFFAARQLIVIPISTLHRLAEEVGEPTVDRKMCFINMTTRCGSTLLSQMLSRVPRVRVMSEPWSFVHIHGLLIQKKVDMDEFRRLLRSVMRLQCKRDNNTEIDLVVIKMTNLVSPMFPLLKEFYPEAKLIFNSRNLKPSIISFMKIVNSLPFFALRSGRSERFAWDHASIPYDDPVWWDRLSQAKAGRHSFENDQEKLVFGFAGEMTEYLKKKDDYHMVILYEDIMEDPDREARRLFKLLDLSTDHLGAALSALNEDSQQGIFGVRGVGNIVISEHQFRRVDEILKGYGIPIRSRTVRDEGNFQTEIYKSQI
jgi:hypothetical protein